VPATDRPLVASSHMPAKTLLVRKTSTARRSAKKG
jgi:hypothetical protein